MTEKIFKDKYGNIERVEKGNRTRGKLNGEGKIITYNLFKGKKRGIFKRGITRFEKNILLLPCKMEQKGTFKKGKLNGKGEIIFKRKGKVKKK